MYDKDRIAEVITKVGKLGIDITEAQRLQKESMKLLERYNREAAIKQEQKIISKYKDEISFAGLFNNIYIVHNMDNNLRKDIDIMCDLVYLSDRIPVYECLKQRKEALAHDILDQIVKVEKNDTRN